MLRSVDLELRIDESLLQTTHLAPGEPTFFKYLVFWKDPLSTLWVWGSGGWVEDSNMESGILVCNSTQQIKRPEVN